MLYNLLVPYINTSHIANLFHYITFRSMVASLLSFTICFVIGPIIIKHLSWIQKNGQPIRDDLTLHQSKAGTPTMGGLIVILSVVASTILLVDLSNKYIWIILFVFISFGILGLLDDYAKIVKNNHKGVSGRSKLIVQTIISLCACVAIIFFASGNYSLQLTIPFFKNLFIDLGYFYLPFCMFVVIGSSNAVNLTDGLDGLAIVPIAIVAGCFMIISYITGNILHSNYLQIIHVANVGEVSIFCASMIGASLGFLWFNAQPAEIFMGDTGSLSCGGALGIISVITKHEIVLAIVGGVFVVETLSVILQVYYFKLTKGKRIFKMAPLHHHFEKKGLPESKVVIRFWIIAVLFALIGLSSLKLR